MQITFKPTLKQHQAWLYLQDKKTNHILYGGSAGSGKSFLGSMWIFLSAIQYPDTRWMVGRARLTNLKRTTLKTIFDIFKTYNYTDYKFNNLNNTITFGNGSEIMLIDLYHYPNDPDYDRLGSLEITGAFIDELSEISEKGFRVLTSRIRYKLKDYKLYPKLFCASNPYQGWSKNYFYIPFIENREAENVKFIQALPQDNPHLSQDYLKTLDKTLDHALKQRLLYGNWDFDSDEYNLFDYNKLQQCFYNEYIVNVDDKYYITADIAELGNDKTIIVLWKGWNAIKIYTFSKLDAVEVSREINKIRNEYKVLIQNIIIDSVGVGAGVASLLKGCIRYMGSSKPVNTGFKNIKTELMYKFAEKVNNLELNFNFNYNDDLIQEALLYKKDFGSNNIAGITSKEDIRKRLGRSPDTMDSLYLRAYWDVGVKRKTIVRFI